MKERQDGSRAPVTDDRPAVVAPALWSPIGATSAAKQEQHIAAHAHALNTHVHILAAVAEAFLHAEAEGLDPFQTVYRSVPKAVVITTVQQARAIARPPTFDYLDLLEPKYLPLRQALLQFYRTLPFQPFRRRDPAILALEHIVVLADRKQRVTTITATVGRKTIACSRTRICRICSGKSTTGPTCSTRRPM